MAIIVSAKGKNLRKLKELENWNLVEVEITRRNIKHIIYLPFSPPLEGVEGQIYQVKLFFNSSYTESASDDFSSFPLS